MALYIPHSIFHLARLLYVRPETFGPYYVHREHSTNVMHLCNSTWDHHSVTGKRTTEHCIKMSWTLNSRVLEIPWRCLWSRHSPGTWLSVNRWAVYSDAVSHPTKTYFSLLLTYYKQYQHTLWSSLYAAPSCPVWEADSSWDSQISNTSWNSNSVHGLPACFSRIYFKRNRPLHTLV